MLFCFTMLVFTNLFSQKTPASFRYNFEDSSVPPPYHRSYSITVDSTSVKLLIDSYGDVLLNEIYSIDAGQFLGFVKELKACSIKNKPQNNDSRGCTGGTGDSFSLFFSEKENISGSIYHCGGKDYGNLKGNVDAAKNLFKSIVPNFSTKMASTEK